MTKFRLPDVGEGLDQAEILEWLVQPGDMVTRDQPLIEILTDKSQTQLPSPVAGTIVSTNGEVGEIIDVGTVLVTFDASSKPDTTLAPAAQTAPALGRSTPAEEVAPSSEPQRPERRPKAAPAVRKRAFEANIELSTVTGTGPGARITQQDLDNAIRGKRAATPQASRTLPPTSGSVVPGRIPLRGIRRATAHAMERSSAIPHIHGHDEFDATDLLNAHRALRARHGRDHHLTLAAFLVMAVADALHHHRFVNSSIDVEQGHIDVHANINIGLAVAAPQGLVVPVIRDADRLSILELGDEIGRMTHLAREGALSADEMAGGTCTVTNYGSLGGRHATPIIRSPEAAIVGFGSIRPRPIVVANGVHPGTGDAGSVEARPTVPISVGADHRLIDGDLMTAFQEHIIHNLSNPVVMLAR